MRLVILPLALAVLTAAEEPPKPLARSVDGLPIGAIPKQELPQSGCAAFFWTATQTRKLIAMASSDPARIRFAPDGKLVDLVRVRQSGPGDFGFLAQTSYAGGDLTVTIEMAIVRRGDLTQGGVVESGTLTIAREGGDSLIVPVVGIIGCAA